MKFDITPWVSSYGKMPRGRGSWAFVTAEHYNTGGELENTVFTPSMTYSEARKWVAVRPEFRSAEVIMVLP
jgi:hypothetical protein